MFPASYFSPSYWAWRFWAKVGAMSRRHVLALTAPGTRSVAASTCAVRTLTVTAPALRVMAGTIVALPEELS